MEKNYSLYMHECPNGKLYFGITSMKYVKQRWRKGKGYEKNEHFTNAINLYGWNNIEHIVLAEGLTKEEVCYYEEFLIAYFDTTNGEKGYNHSSGGELNLPSEQTRKKMSEQRKGRPSPMKGKILSEETKAKISESTKMTMNRPEVKAKISETNKQAWANKSEEEMNDFKAKMSETNKQTWANKTEEEMNDFKAKMEETNKNLVIQIDLISLRPLRIFNSAVKAQEFMGKPKTHTRIHMCCQGKAKTAYKYHWARITITEL